MHHSKLSTALCFSTSIAIPPSSCKVTDSSVLNPTPLFPQLLAGIRSRLRPNCGAVDLSYFLSDTLGDVHDQTLTRCLRNALPSGFHPDDLCNHVSSMDLCAKPHMLVRPTYSSSIGFALPPSFPRPSAPRPHHGAARLDPRGGGARGRPRSASHRPRGRPPHRSPPGVRRVPHARH